MRRAVLALGALAVATPLAVAITLTPNPKGHGTHEQLGFPPCTTTVVLGIRCPACGMTTSWAHLLRGQGVGAIQANATGALACVAAILTMLTLTWAAIGGAWPRWTPSYNLIVAGLTLWLAMAFLEWGLRLFILKT